MSIAVPLDDLPAEIARRGPGFLLSVSGDERVRVTALFVTAAGGHLVIAGVGARTCASLALRPAVTLLFPPPDPQAMSLIVDGDAVVDDDEAGLVTVRPTGAVLHRPAPDPPALDEVLARIEQRRGDRA